MIAPRGHPLCMKTYRTVIPPLDAKEALRLLAPGTVEGNIVIEGSSPDRRRV